MKGQSVVGMIDEDGFNLGKADSWAGRPKQSPEHDSRAASQYELGYSEGEIKPSPVDSASQIDRGDH